MAITIKVLVPCIVSKPRTCMPACVAWNHGAQVLGLWQQAITSAHSTALEDQSIFGTCKVRVAECIHNEVRCSVRCKSMSHTKNWRNMNSTNQILSRTLPSQGHVLSMVPAVPGASIFPVVLAQILTQYIGRLVPFLHHCRTHLYVQLLGPTIERKYHPL